MHLWRRENRRRTVDLPEQRSRRVCLAWPRIFANRPLGLRLFKPPKEICCVNPGVWLSSEVGLSSLVTSPLLPSSLAPSLSSPSSSISKPDSSPSSSGPPGTSLGGMRSAGMEVKTPFLVAGDGGALGMKNPEKVRLRLNRRDERIAEQL